tara:strand:- start:604510 stop:605034 length:525 start_codon:yes stop_codon:yes gene_type:complete
MSINTAQILTAMKIVFWIIFIGLLIQSGALLVTYIISLNTPDAAQNLYLGLDLSELYAANRWHYTSFLSFLIIIGAMKAYLAFLVVQTLTKIDLEKPFSVYVSDRISKISHNALSIGFVSLIAQAHTKYLAKSVIALDYNWQAAQFLFLAAIIYIISKIFKKGIELQAENELTI